MPMQQTRAARPVPGTRRQLQRADTFTRQSRPGSRGAADLRDRAARTTPASICRSRSRSSRRLGRSGAQSAPIGLPGLSEPETMRHYVRLSQKNYAIDSGDVSAGLVHDEAQPAAQREDGAACRLRRRASAAAARRPCRARLALIDLLAG